MEQKQYWGTGIIRFFFLDFWGTEEQSNLFKENKEIGTTLEGPHSFQVVQVKARLKSETEQEIR